MLARVFAGAGSDFGGEEVHDRAVLVGRPHAAVVAQETRPGALLAAKTAGAVEESWHEPFEADRHLGQPASELVHHAIDHAAADQCLAGLNPDRWQRRRCTGP